MLILGIETSCDDTGVAVIKFPPKHKARGVNFEILSNIISSQIKTHAPFGGVVPNLAAREHLKNIEPCLRTAIKEANVKMKEIDLIAVTYGPGLIPSLLIGVNFAKALAYKYRKPIIGINHIEAHVVAALAKNIRQKMKNKIAFPAIALVVSGGHTQLILARKIGDYKIIGETRDDAAGECFDKVAKLLNLGFPGGPRISEQATKFNPLLLRGPRISLPRPMIKHKNYDFSFSGLKTAVLYLTQNQKSKIKNQSFIQELCFETQQAIIDVLIEKTIRAAKNYKAKTIILAGGVAANQALRKQLEIQSLKLKINFLVPEMSLCTDNGAMVAIAGYLNQKKIKPENWKALKANSNLRI